MPVITRLIQPPTSPNRCRIHIDGRLAFTCHATVISRLNLHVGRELSASDLARIRAAESDHKCLAQAIKFLETRLHSRLELQRKLLRNGCEQKAVSAALDELERMGYIDDRRFAQAKAQSAAEHRHHGPHRAMRELLKSGVDRSVASRAIEDTYDQRDNLAVARALAAKQAPRLRRLDPLVARRRLAGMLLRRGFDYETIRPVIDEVLGHGSET
jgi:regulatory protein